MKALLLSLVIPLVLSTACLADGNGSHPRWSGGQGRQHSFSDHQTLFGPNGGFSKAVLDKQFFKPAPLPSQDEALTIAAQEAAKAAQPLIDTSFHQGRQLLVPEQFPTIQQALDQAKAGDSVVVKPGIYYEQLTIKDGVRLVSDHGPAGQEMQEVDGALLKLPSRALTTIIDGSQSKASAKGMLNFPEGAGRHTVVDGFTIRNLPAQNHHIPGHAHAVNLRGASPVISNCLITANGSTGVGSHVIYHDQEKAIAERDFRHANIRSQSSAVLYRNIVSHNLGRGIGCNHFSSPMILGNEVFANDDSSLGESVGPGIGAKHGASPTMIGNVVHDNPSGGIMTKLGAPQGKHEIDIPTRPQLKANVVFSNGAESPNISCHNSGTEEQPTLIRGNYVSQAGNMAIGLTDKSVAILEDNIITGSRFVGIAIKGSRMLALNNNTITATKTSAVVVSLDSILEEMEGNRVFGVGGAPFVKREMENL